MARHDAEVIVRARLPRSTPPVSIAIPAFASARRARLVLSPKSRGFAALAARDNRSDWTRSPFKGTLIAGAAAAWTQARTPTVMLYVVGLGLGDERDITVNGLEAVKKCERVYLEAYTSILGVPKERLEALYGREVVVADREFVEQGIDGMLNEALEMDVAFLVRAHIPGLPAFPAFLASPRRGASSRASAESRPPPPPAARFSPSRPVPTREPPADSQPPPPSRPTGGR